MINIRTNGSWTITTNANWVTGLPLTGAGDFNYEPILSANTTGSYRTGTITVTMDQTTYRLSNSPQWVSGEDYMIGQTIINQNKLYIVTKAGSSTTGPTNTSGSSGPLTGGSLVVSFLSQQTKTVAPIVQNYSVMQYANDTTIFGRVYILGHDEDLGYKVKYSVEANGNTQLSSAVACGGSVDISGKVETGIIPKTGATVNLKAYNPATISDEIKPFSWNFGNDMYWKTSSTPMDTALDAMSGATRINPTYDSTNDLWYGSFTASYGAGHTYLYIIFDYRNFITDGYTVSAGISKTFYPFNVNCVYPINSLGMARVEYPMSRQFTGLYNGAVAVGGSTSGNYYFSKSIASVNTMKLAISAGTGDVSLRIYNPTTASFTMVTTGSTSYSTACSSTTPTATRYHNGAGTYPSVGDTVYTSGTTPMDGDIKYYKIPADNSVIKIDDNGVVTEYLSCACSEVSIPVVTAETFNMYIGSSTQIKLSATNNPSLWRITSNLSYYAISGNGYGGSYSYTDINGNSITDAVGIDQIANVVSSTVPTYDTGITISNQGTYSPPGFSIDNSGALSIEMADAGTYTVSVIAENCVGSSTAATITVHVKPQPTLKPVKMASEGSSTSGSACLLNGCVNTFWFNGSHSYPVVNDKIYLDGYGKDYFNGGYMYYKMDNNYYILIDGTGQVVEKASC